MLSALRNLSLNSPDIKGLFTAIKNQINISKKNDSDVLKSTVDSANKAKLTQSLTKGWTTLS